MTHGCIIWFCATPYYHMQRTTGTFGVLAQFIDPGSSQSVDISPLSLHFPMHSLVKGNTNAFFNNSQTITKIDIMLAQ
jgi:hypothetical protein